MLKKSLAIMVLGCLSVMSFSAHAESASAPAAATPIESQMDLSKIPPSALPAEMSYNILMTVIPLYFQGQIGQEAREEKRLLDLANHLVNQKETPEVVRAHAYGVLAFASQCSDKKATQKSLVEVYKLVDGDKTLTNNEKKQTKNAFFKVVNGKKCVKK